MAKEGKRGRKVGRMKDWCKAYAARGQEDTNRKKKRLRHIKSNPTDSSALESYTRDYGTPTGLKPTAKGRKIVKRNKQPAVVTHKTAAA